MLRLTWIPRQHQIGIVCFIMSMCPVSIHMVIPVSISHESGMCGIYSAFYNSILRQFHHRTPTYLIKCYLGLIIFFENICRVIFTEGCYIKHEAHFKCVLYMKFGCRQQKKTCILFSVFEHVFLQVCIALNFISK